MVTCNRKIRVQHIQLDSGQQNADGLPAGGKLAKRGRCEGVCQGGRGERDGWLSVLWTGVSPGVTPITKPTQSRRHSNHEANSVSGKAHAETACSRRDGTQRRSCGLLTLMRFVSHVPLEASISMAPEATPSAMAAANVAPCPWVKGCARV